MGLLVLCDTIGEDGGTESYWHRVLPALRAAGVALTVAARRVTASSDLEDVEHEIGWGTEDAPSVPDARRTVERILAKTRPEAVILSNVFDEGVVHAARSVPRLIVRIHDHRLTCPNGNRVYPQFPAICERAMGPSCLVNSFVRGCMHGAHPKTVARLAQRERLWRKLTAADRFVVSSHFMARLAQTNGVHPHAIDVIEPPCSEQSLRRPPAPRPAVTRVLFAGRTVPEKGLMSLVGAVGRIPAARRPPVDVAGTPCGETQRAAEFAAANGVRLHVLGRLNGAALDRAYDAATLVAVPSVWAEPFGLVGIEAFARGRPVVAYAVGGIPEWMEGGGITVPRADEGALARAIEDAFEPIRWQHLAIAARRHAERYTPRAHAERLLRVAAIARDPSVA